MSIHVQTEPFDIGSGLVGGHFMQTTVDIPDGESTMYATTRTWCTNVVSGFTGGVVVTFLDAAQRVIGRTEPQPYGVDALAVFFKPHDRTENWTAPVPAGTAGVKVVHFHSGHDRWDEDVAQVLKAISDAIAVYDTASQFCEQHPDLCSFSGQSA